MAGFGERLRRERELRGIKLEEIAESTKVAVRYLRALEQEDLEKLPGGIFSKGFVRAYARYLGIDEEEAISDFVRLAGEAEAGLPQPPPPPEKPQIETRYSRWWLVLAVLALIAVGVYYGRKSPRITAWKARITHSQPQPELPPAQPPQVAAAAAGNQAAAASGSTPANPPPPVPAAATQAATEEPAGRVVIELRTTHPAWVQWSVDDAPPQEATFAANEQKRLAGNSKVRLKVGDAGAVELTYNGKTIAPLGNDKQVKTVTFTAEGMQE